MPTEQIKSSFIKSVTHDTKTFFTVEFKGKKGPSRFRYFGVPFFHYVDMVLSKDPGNYYKDKIKKKYASIKLKPNQA